MDERANSVDAASEADEADGDPLRIIIADDSHSDRLILQAMVPPY